MKIDETSGIIVSEIELVFKSKSKPSARPQINTSFEAFQVFNQTWDHNKIELVEQFKVLFLNQGNKVLAVFDASTGGLTGTVADPRVIYAAALKVCAVSIIICHNHPSGSLKPSRQDEELSQKIKEAGRFLDIKLIDSMIISTEGYFSFADEGIL